MTQPAVFFSGPKRIPYLGGCVTEPAPYALEYLLKWPADITVKGKVYENKPVFSFVQELLKEPATYDLTPAEAEAARDLYLDLAGQTLKAEGGNPDWLLKEFKP